MSRARDLAAPEAELSVLAACVRDSAAFALVRHEVSLHPQEFRDRDLRTLYEVLCNLEDRGEAVTDARLRAELRRVGAEGSDTILSRLGKVVTRSIRADAELIREMSFRSSVVRVSQEIMESAFTAATLEEVRDVAERGMLALRAHSGIGGWRHVREYAADVRERIVSHEPIGITSGLPGLDYMTGGLPLGGLSLLAGRPGNGKTELAINIAAHAARLGIPVGFCSYEMPSAILNVCLRARLAKMSKRDIFLVSPARHAEVLARVAEAESELSELPLFFDDRLRPSLSSFRSATRRFAEEHGSGGLMIVDYLQLMHAGGECESKALELAEIAGAMVDIAQELGIAVLALSQLNREATVKNSTPDLSHLKSSDGPGEAASLVMSIARKDAGKSGASAIANYGRADLTVLKNRLFGETGTIKLRFDPEKSEFAEEDERSG